MEPNQQAQPVPVVPPQPNMNIPLTSQPQVISSSQNQGGKNFMIIAIVAVLIIVALGLAYVFFGGQNLNLLQTQKAQPSATPTTSEFDSMEDEATKDDIGSIDKEFTEADKDISKL